MSTHVLHVHIFRATHTVWERLAKIKRFAFAGLRGFVACGNTFQTFAYDVCV